MSDLEKLPSEVADLLAREREIPRASDAARARVAARLGLGPALPPPQAPGWWAGAKVAIMVAGLAGGAAWVASRRAPTPMGAPAPALETPKPPASPPPPPSPEPVPTPAPAARAPAPETEIAVLLRARHALARGDAAQALAALERHRRRWPSGELLQEREVLAIQALARMGAQDQARRRADAFLTRFPSSTLAATVRQVRAQLGE